MFTVPQKSVPAVALACLWLAGCGGSSTVSSTATTATTPARVPASVRAAGAAHAPVRSVTRRRPRPPDPCHDAAAGSKPQLDVVPSSATACFRAKMAALWDGIRLNSPHAARAAFFPERAYVQLKAIGDPEGDYQGRLLEDYKLDLAAAHDILGSNAARARLVDVVVPADYAHWVPAGVCDNDLGYYETPNSRVVYREGGEVHSIGIASLISWRGIWYVIHLGAVVRPEAEGLVDDPEAGPGVPVASSIC